MHDRSLVRCSPPRTGWTTTATPDRTRRQDPNSAPPRIRRRGAVGVVCALSCGDVRGPGRARTDDSRGVNAVLYQLSYRPQTAIRAAVKLVSQPNRSAP